MGLLDWLLGKLFGKAPTLTDAERRRWVAWHALPEPDLDRSAASMRIVSVDVETTGLSLETDRLIAIGAVGIQAERVDLADSFYAVLRQPQASSNDNILVHGIGGTEQMQGEPPVDVLLRFMEFIGHCPLVAFHAPFDASMLDQAARDHFGARLGRTWLDLAWLAPALLPEDAARRSLDDWLEKYGITVAVRHNALADAVATAQLHLVLQHVAERQQHVSTASLIELAGAARLADQ
jgi:DNA polymerase-3 subunit epsilon